MKDVDEVVAYIAFAGVSLSRAIAGVREMVQAVGKDRWLIFNDTPVRIRTGDTADDIVRDWQRKRGDLADQAASPP